MAGNLPVPPEDVRPDIYKNLADIIQEKYGF